MSVLTGPEIRRLAEGGVGANGERIVIDPFDPARCGPASYDVHLGDEMRVYKLTASAGFLMTPIDPMHPQETRLLPMDDRGVWILFPRRVYLAPLREHVAVHRLATQLAGRSSIGRLGLFVHVTAGFIDPGWGCLPDGESDGKSVLTLELVATQPILVRPGMRIAQLVFSTLVGEYQAYRGRYLGDAGAVASRFHLPDPNEEPS